MLKVAAVVLPLCNAFTGYTSDGKTWNAKTVSVNTEWDTLEEVIVGRSASVMPNAQANWLYETTKILPGDDSAEILPCIEEGNFNNWGLAPNPNPTVDCEGVPEACCPFNKVQREVDSLVALLDSYGVVVQRPEVYNRTVMEGNFGPDTFPLQGGMNQFARDVMQVVENILIELTPGAANRRGELLNYHKFFEERFEGADAARFAMPTRDFSVQNYGAGLSSPVCDDFFVPDCVSPYNKNDYVVIEGGDVMLMGDTILVGHSDNTVMGSSLKGINWLRQTLNMLGFDKKVIPVRLDAKVLHLDIVMSLPREGLAIIASGAFEDGTLPFPDGVPAIFEEQGWDVITASGLSGMYMSANCLPISPEVLVMASNSLAPKHIQDEIVALHEEVRAKGITVHVLEFGYHGMNGGALRCSCHPLRRNPNAVAKQVKQV